MDELENLGLDQYLMNTTALSPLSAAAMQSLPTAQPTQQAAYNPAPAGLSATNPFVTANTYGMPNALLWGGTDAETGLVEDLTNRDINEMKALNLGAGRAGSTEVYIPGVGLQLVSNRSIPVDAITASWTPGTPIYEASQGFFSPEPGKIRQGNAVAYHPGYQYQLIDNLTGKVLGTANNEAAFKQLAAVSSQAAAPSRDNKLVDLALQRAAPGGDTPQWDQIKQYRYEPVHGFQTFLSAALPMVLGAAAPLIGPISGALGASGAAAAGTALGSAASGAIAGKPIGDILKNAALAGGSAYLGGELFKNLGGAGPSGPNAIPPGVEGVGDFLPFETITSAMTPAQISNAILGGATAAPIAGGLGGALGDIVVTGSQLGGIAPGVAAGVGGLAGGLASLPSSPSFEQQFDQSMGEQPIEVIAPQTPGMPFPVVPVAPTVPPYTGGDIVVEAPKAPEPTEQPSLAVPVTPTVPPYTGGDIVVEAPKAPEPTEQPSLAVPVTPTAPPYTGGDIVVEAPKTPEPAEQPSLAVPVTPTVPPYTGGDIVVEAPKTPAPAEEPPIVVPPVTPPTTTTPLDTATADTKADAKGDKSTLDKIIDYLQLAGLGTGLLGNLLGSGGSSPAAFYRGAGTPVSPIFGATLPAANLPGGAQSLAARPGSALAQQGLGTTQDWYRYGYGPEQSFFVNVPQGARNTSTAYTGYAKGGDVEPKKRGSFAVRGPGTGRSDDIPALLSDGEYVIDAETVALLGDGSNEAGAKRLDDFRVNVRKHKGRKLARGKFSVNAKKPEAYMAGGRT